MGTIAIPAMPEKHTTVYNNFRGVDFTVDPPLVGKDRSPESVNMISDAGGNPKKRLGWRTVKRYNGPINGIYRCDVGGEHIFVHAGTEIHDITQDKVLAYDVTSQKGCGFSAIYSGRSCYFILTGGEYLMYDGVSLRNVRDIAYIPTVAINRDPSGTNPEYYEALNLLTPQRIVSFLGNETDTIYHLPDAELDDSFVSVAVMDESGNWNTLAAEDYTVDRAAGTVTFTQPYAPVIVGQDNVRICYGKTVNGSHDKIVRCTLAAIYGHGQQMRVFVSGNSEYPAYDWHSAVEDPTYFPADSYSVIGSVDTAVIGYQKLGDYLGIVKEDNDQDTTVFLRTGSESENGNTIFSLFRGVAGIGAVSPRSFATLNDEPLFLSRNGVYATGSTQVQYERSAQNRSWWVDKRLTAEPNLKDACACVFGGNYLLAVNGHVYVLDGKRMSSVNGGHSYDCYYWDNVPAVCWLANGNDLWFGTADGRVCRFNTDVDSVTAYNDDGKAVYASWSTVDDNDGATQLLKTMQKRGGVVTLSPFSRSSVKIFISVDGQADELVREGSTRFFDFSAIDFEDFTFEASDAPQTVFINRKKKKYKRMQIVVVNDRVNEGFGIHEIVKTFVYGNYAKK